jgi:hypothetical protein
LFKIGLVKQGKNICHSISSTINLPKEFPDDDFHEWKKKTNRIKLPTSFFKKVFLGVLGFSLITLIVAGIIIYSGKTSVSGDLISMEIVYLQLVPFHASKNLNHV